MKGSGPTRPSGTLRALRLSRHVLHDIDWENVFKGQIHRTGKPLAEAFKDATRSSQQ